MDNGQHAGTKALKAPDTGVQDGEDGRLMTARSQSGMVLRMIIICTSVLILIYDRLVTAWRAQPSYPQVINMLTSYPQPVRLVHKL